MKREKSKYQIPIFHPLIFWQECYKCKEEFRRENGGRFYFGQNFKTPKPSYCVCESCLSDYNSSEKDIRTFFFGERPPPPGPSPTTEHVNDYCRKTNRDTRRPLPPQRPTTRYVKESGI